MERLLESGLCRTRDPQKHGQELKRLVEQINENDVKRLSHALKAIADPTRIKILRLLKSRPMCTCEVMVALNLTEPNASHHLNLLERNDIVKSEKMGRWVFYSLQQSILRNMANIITG